MVWFELMDKFGYYVMELFEYNVEYYLYFIKWNYFELISEL